MSTLCNRYFIWRYYAKEKQKFDLPPQPMDNAYEYSELFLEKMKSGKYHLSGQTAFKSNNSSNILFDAGSFPVYIQNKTFCSIILE